MRKLKQVVLISWIGPLGQFSNYRYPLNGSLAQLHEMSRFKTTHRLNSWNWNIYEKTNKWSWFHEMSQWAKWAIAQWAVLKRPISSIHKHEINFSRNFGGGGKILNLPTFQKKCGGGGKILKLFKKLWRWRWR